jgi:isopentenyl diphosphate isomerase/L-lactate dehydrogenase-like FMN-dependent dehydrogenase
MKNVLIVDDARSIRNEVTDVLTRAGYNVIEAADGTEALAYLAGQAAVDLVVLDVNMPGMNGLDVLDRIQQEHKARNIPILMLTTEAERVLVERAKKAGAKGLIVTLDWSFSHGRDWGSPSIPEKMDWKTILKYIPEGAMRPRWGLEFLRSGKIPDLTVPNIPTQGEQPPTFFGAYGQWMFTPPATWADVAWLREQWGTELPFCVKGITRVDDAKRAVDAGATAIQVSNHGGNNLDSTPAPIRVLPGIVEAVGRDVEVILDGGIRRGSDVVKALALGARAVAIGRAYLWGLAAAGQPGVENVFEILRNGIGSGLMGLGRSSVHDLVPEDIIIPPNFTRQAVV